MRRGDITPASSSSSRTGAIALAALRSSPAVAIGDQPDADDGTRRAILAETTNRLVLSRLHEVEQLKSKLQELSVALQHAERVRQEIEQSVDRDVRVAIELTAQCSGANLDVQYAYSFSQFFKSLIGRFSASGQQQ